MGRRREPQFATDQDIAVTPLDRRDIRRAARMRNASTWGIAVEIDCPVTPGTLMRVEFEDRVALGESLYCREAAGAYWVGVRLEQALTSIADLDRSFQEPDAQERIARTP